MASLLGILLEIIFSIVNSTTGLLGKLALLFNQLIIKASATGKMGVSGFLASLLVLSLAILVIWKFVFPSVKHLAILFVIGVAALLMLFLFA